VVMLYLLGPLVVRGWGAAVTPYPLAVHSFYRREVCGDVVPAWSTHHMSRWGRMGDVVQPPTCRDRV
jgi:hypothetical protein